MGLRPLGPADEGIWETRGGPKKFLYSQLMCWVAIERAIRLATRRGLPAECPRRVNHQDLVTTAHLPGGETRFIAKGSHGHEGAPGNTRRSEPPVNPARFTYE